MRGCSQGVIQSVGRRNVQYFNYAYQRTGTLWKGRYRATVVDSECYLLTCTRYIELNPLRARMVEYPAEYSWSSHHANARGAPDILVTPHELYKRLGQSQQERQRAYRQLFCSQLPRGDIEATIAFHLPADLNSPRTGTTRSNGVTHSPEGSTVDGETHDASAAIDIQKLPPDGDALLGVITDRHTEYSPTLESKKRGRAYQPSPSSFCSKTIRNDQLLPSHFPSLYGAYVVVSTG